MVTERKVKFIEVTGTPSGNIKKRGLAQMTVEKRTEIARKGGVAIAKNREHMREIGRKGAMARWGAAPAEKKEGV